MGRASLPAAMDAAVEVLRDALRADGKKASIEKFTPLIRKYLAFNVDRGVGALSDLPLGSIEAFIDSMATWNAATRSVNGNLLRTILRKMHRLQTGVPQALTLYANGTDVPDNARVSGGEIEGFVPTDGPERVEEPRALDDVNPDDTRPLEELDTRADQFEQPPFEDDEASMAAAPAYEEAAQPAPVAAAPAAPAPPVMRIEVQQAKPAAQRPPPVVRPTPAPARDVFSTTMQAQKKVAVYRVSDRGIPDVAAGKSVKVGVFENRDIGAQQIDDWLLKSIVPSLPVAVGQTAMTFILVEIDAMGRETNLMREIPVMLPQAPQAPQYGGMPGYGQQPGYGPPPNAYGYPQPPAYGPPGQPGPWGDMHVQQVKQQLDESKARIAELEKMKDAAKTSEELVRTQRLIDEATRARAELEEMKRVQTQRPMTPFGQFGMQPFGGGQPFNPFNQYPPGMSPFGAPPAPAAPPPPAAEPEGNKALETLATALAARSEPVADRSAENIAKMQLDMMKMQMDAQARADDRFSRLIENIGQKKEDPMMQFLLQQQKDTAAELRETRRETGKTRTITDSLTEFQQLQTLMGGGGGGGGIVTELLENADGVAMLIDALRGKPAPALPGTEKAQQQMPAAEQQQAAVEQKLIPPPEGAMRALADLELARDPTATWAAMFRFMGELEAVPAYKQARDGLMKFLSECEEASDVRIWVRSMFYDLVRQSDRRKTPVGKAAVHRASLVAIENYAYLCKTLLGIDRELEIEEAPMPAAQAPAAPAPMAAVAPAAAAPTAASAVAPVAPAAVAGAAVPKTGAQIMRERVVAAQAAQTAASVTVAVVPPAGPAAGVGEKEEEDEEEEEDEAGQDDEQDDEGGESAEPAQPVATPALPLTAAQIFRERQRVSA